VWPVCAFRLTAKILLIWVYYSAQIVLFGAELTHAYATETGSRRTTDVNAELPHKTTA
jgi:uncharacterized BrkB/YihY/UPF0761 family membrane protein